VKDDESDARSRAPSARASPPWAFTKANMRAILTVVGILLMLVGAVWFLQGINVLPGSFMTGQVKWAIYGGCAFVAGIALLAAARRLGR
jgi:hypothetical protein